MSALIGSRPRSKKMGCWGVKDLSQGGLRRTDGEGGEGDRFGPLLKSGLGAFAKSLQQELVTIFTGG